jgi:hypothetical protein
VGEGRKERRRKEVRDREMGGLIRGKQAGVVAWGPPFTWKNIMNDMLGNVVSVTRDNALLIYTYEERSCTFHVWTRIIGAKKKIGKAGHSRLR